MKRRRALLLLLLALVILALATVRIEEDSRGVWTGRGPGVRMIYIPDQRAPGIWLYVGGHIVWHNHYDGSNLSPESEPPARPAPRPLRRVMELEQV